MFESGYNYFETVYDNLFTSGNSKGTKAVASSGIEKFGWYAQIVIAAESIDKVEFVEQMNVHRWFNFMSVKRAEQIIKNG